MQNITEHATHSSSSTTTPVVALAGAAGSRQALEMLVRNLPDDSGLAFIVLTNMGSEQAKRLPALLEKRTNMPVVAAVDGLPPVADHLYVAPANTTVTLPDKRFRLRSISKKATAQGAAIGVLDALFTSLAETYGNQATAVLLSGTGKDGVTGAERICSAGGILFIQEPDEASHGALLRRAVAACPQAIVATAGDIARHIVQVRGDLADGAAAPSADATADELLVQILQQVAAQTGHDLSHYKFSTLMRRIARRMAMSSASNLAHYVEIVKSSPRESQAFFKDTLVSVTNFFRDPDAYEMLERDCIPQLFAEKRRSDYVRVWVAGCATGQEAYSVAMQLVEYASQVDEPPRVQLFATDLDEEAIAFARRGVYPAAVASEMTPGRLERFFTPVENGYQVKPEIREHVLFAVHDLLRDPPFLRLDLITCRNVLIYFNRAAQEKVLNVFHYSLNSRGYLFLGTSESVDATPNLFAVLDKHCHLYQRREAATLRQSRQLPPILSALSGRGSVRDASTKPAASRTLEEAYTSWSLRVHTPPRLLVNSSYEITHLFGEVSRFLQHPEGSVTQNVLQRILPDLRLDLRIALHHAFSKGERSISRALRVEIAGDQQLIQLQVGPVGEEDFPSGYVEVLFVAIQESSVLESTATSRVVETDLVLVRRLEEELVRNRERLQSMIEEYENSSQELRSSNEELQSINEELKSTTEELETSKEELQSMNEELTTVNSELTEKIEALNRANSDLLNFIASTDVGAIFLDSDLRISRFTPRATRLFNLIESDKQRPISHISHRIRHAALANLASYVRETADPVEETVQSTDNQWYLLRMFPYLTLGNQVDGVVITFVDISDLKRAESEERQRRQQQVLAELSRQALNGNELDTLFQLATQQVAQVLEMPLCKVLELEADEKSFLLRAGVGWQPGLVGNATVPSDTGSQAGYTLLAQSPVVVRDLQSETRFQASALLVDHGVRSGMSVTIYGPDRAYGVLGVHDRQERSFATYDVDFLQAMANTLAAAVTRRAHLTQLQFQANILSQIEDAVIAVDKEERLSYLNAAATNQYGVNNAKAALGKPLSALFERQWPTAQAEMAAQAALAQNGSWHGENVHRRPDGLEIPVESTINVLTDDDQSLGLLMTIRNMRERKAAEEARRQSEARLQLATTVAGLAIAEFDYAADTVHLSNEAAVLLGLGVEGMTVPRSTIHALMHPDDVAEFWHRLNRALDPAGSGEYVMEHRIVRPDGQVRWISVREQIFFTYPDDGPAYPLQALMVAIDVTPYKQIEAELRQSEVQARRHLNELEAIYNSAPVGLCVMDQELRYVRINERLAQINGVPAEEHIGRSGRELFPDLADKSEAALRQILVTGEGVIGVELRGEIPAQPGVQHTWIQSWLPLHNQDGEVVAINIVIEEITERKAAEEALRQSEERYRYLFENVDDGFCIVEIILDEQGHPVDYRFLEANPSFERHTGLVQVIGKTARDLVPGLEDQWVQVYGQVALTGKSNRFEMGSEVMGRWFDVYAFRIGNDESRRVAIFFKDFSDRRNAEIQMQNSEQHLRNVLNNLTAFVGVMTPDGILLEANRTALQAANLRAEEVVGKHFAHTYWWSFSESTQGQLRAAIARAAAGQIVRYDATVRLGPERYIVIDFMLAPIVDDSGRITHLIPSGVDVTERRLMETALRESEEQFRAVQQATPDGFMILESVRTAAGAICDFRWRYLNPAAEEIIGRGQADLVDKLLLEVLPGYREEGLFHAYVQVVESGQVWRREFLYQHEGMDHWFRSTAAKAGDGLAVAFTDITENRRAEVALADSERRFRNTFEQAAVGMAHTAFDGRFVRVNDRLCRILGYAREELLQMHFIEVIHPADLEDSIALNEELAAGTIPSYTAEKRYLRRNGQPVWVNVTASAVRNAAGELEYRLAVVEDISSRKEAEQELQELNATLEERVRARTAELERSNRELDQFAYIASHDLKAPLRAIEHLAGWINQDAGDLLPDSSQRHLETLRARVQRMEQLLEDLLLYSRAGRQLGEADVVESGPLILSLLELLNAPATFTVTVDDTMPTFYTLRIPLEVVLRNLIGNAIKHHHRENGHIHVSAQERDKFVLFTVEDDGPGISPQFHERIFQIFQTLRPRDQVEGSGMGLAIVKKTIEHMDGTIWIESNEGQGAKFQFTWPKLVATST